MPEGNEDKPCYFVGGGGGGWVGRNAVRIEESFISSHAHTIEIMIIYL